MIATQASRSAPQKPATAKPSPSLPEEVLAKAQSGRTVIQDFCPLAESLEWQLGQDYLRDRGNKAFIGDASPVPYVVNNSGELSYHAAEVFYVSLTEAEHAGHWASDEPLFVLELGIGVGLFARFFLDAFRDVCAKNGTDYYDRLTYIAADRSERMLSDLCRHGVLRHHAGRYVTRQVDAMAPESLARDVLFRGTKESQPAPGSNGHPTVHAPKPPHPSPLSPAGERGEDGSSPPAPGSNGHPAPPATPCEGGEKRGILRAVFLNYLLDCLPAAVLELKDDKVNELHVRTVLARNVRLENHTEWTTEQLAERAKFTDARSRRELLEVYGLFASEYDYRPADLRTMPYADFALQLAKGKTKYFLHSYGALECLHQLMKLVHPRGFILMNDYGSTKLEMENQFEHQRFSLATFVGVNFAELAQCFDQLGGRYDWTEPQGDADASIHSRLLMHRHNFQTSERFLDMFGPAEQKRLQEPINKARQWQQHGRFELANDEYRKAVALQPYNWVLLNEMANFLIFRLRGDRRDVYGGVKAGIDMAKLALAQNPSCSAELWSTLGDGLFEYGRYAEARSAYLKALQVNDKDVRARFNLAFVHIRERDYPAALKVIAEALALDKMGQYRDRLLQKQQEALALLAQQNQQEYLLLINLVSKYAAPVEKDRE